MDSGIYGHCGLFLNRSKTADVMAGMDKRLYIAVLENPRDTLTKILRVSWMENTDHKAVESAILLNSGPIEVARMLRDFADKLETMAHEITGSKL